MADRAALAARQREVLGDLLGGRVPAGFDPTGSRLTSQVLHRKRSDDALGVCPELADLPGWREAFHRWAAGHRQRGCAHDDVRRFVGAVAAAGQHPGWLVLHEVHTGVRRGGRVSRDGAPAIAVRVGGYVVVVDLPTHTPRRHPLMNVLVAVVVSCIAVVFVLIASGFVYLLFLIATGRGRVRRGRPGGSGYGAPGAGGALWVGSDPGNTIDTGSGSGHHGSHGSSSCSSSSCSSSSCSSSSCGSSCGGGGGCGSSN